MDPNEMYNRIKRIAENKLTCECGNAQWVNFLFFEGGTDCVIGACKRCGAVYEYDKTNGSWVFKTKPEG